MDGGVGGSFWTFSSTGDLIPFACFRDLFPCPLAGIITLQPSGQNLWRSSNRVVEFVPLPPLGLVLLFFSPYPYTTRSFPLVPEFDQQVFSLQLSNIFLNRPCYLFFLKSVLPPPLPPFHPCPAKPSVKLYSVQPHNQSDHPPPSYLLLRKPPCRVGPSSHFFACPFFFPISCRQANQRSPNLNPVLRSREVLLTY